MAELETLGKYEIRRTVGRGAVGTVLEGWDPIIQRRVAIKTVRLDGADDPDAQEQINRFRREAQAAGRLVHPSIVTIHDYGEAGDLAYIVMEYVEGPSLKTVLDLGHTPRREDIVRIMEDVLSGLGFSHQHGIIHRDIKPGNIMLTSENLATARAKIADFGIARVESSTLTQAGTMMGTPAYMAPEQFLGETIDARSDIYAAGVLLYQLLTGQRPFEGSISSIMHQVLTNEPRPPSTMVMTVDPTLDPVVLKAIAKRPAARYQHAAAFAEALREAMAATLEEADPPDRTIQAATPPRAEAPLAPPAMASTAPRAAPAEPPGAFDGDRAMPPPAVASSGGSRLSLVVASLGLAGALGLGAWLFLSEGRLTRSGEFSQATVTPPPPPVASAPASTGAATPGAPPSGAPTAGAPTLGASSPGASATAPPSGALPSAALPTAPPSAVPPPTVAPPSAATPAPVTAAPVAPVARVEPPAPTSPAATTGAAPSPAPSTAPPVASPPAVPPVVAPVVPPLVAPGGPPGGPPAAASVTPPPVATTPLTTPPVTTLPASPPVTPPAAATAPVPPTIATAPVATPPVATPPPPITPVGPVTAFTSAGRAELARLVNGARCAILDGGVGPGGATLRGVALAGVEAQLRRALAEQGVQGRLDWQAADTDQVFCPALDTLRPIRPAFDSDAPRLQLTLADDRTVLREGQAIRPRLIMPPFAAYLYVGYVAHDGNVQHLYPQVADARQGIKADPVRLFAPSEWINLGDPGPGQRGWEASEPFGRDMIISVASARPLFPTPRPANTEAADTYLRALERAIEALRQAGVQATAAAVPIEVTPR